MANELKYIGLDTQSGLTLTAEIYAEDGTIQGSAISATEVGTTAIYVADMPAVGAATYAIRFFNGTSVVGTGFIEWNGTEEVTLRDVEADITALNNFDPANDTVARVTLVDTTTVNTDMRGTDGANTTAPDNTSITEILADTNELQTNQGNFTTATGFAVPGDIPSAADVADAVWDEPIADHATAGSTGEALSNAETDLAPALTAIGNLNNFDPATDTVARVTLVDITTTNTDMRGTDGANTVAPDNTSIADILVDTNELQTNQGNFATATGFAVPGDIPSPADIYAEFTSGSNEDAFKADVSGLSVDLTPVTDAIDNLNDPTPAEIYAEFTSGGNEDAFKANVATLATASALQVVDGNVDQLLLEVAAVPTASEIYTEFTLGNNEDVFKADTSGLTVDLQPVLDAISTQTTTITGRFDTVDNSLTAANADTDQILSDVAALDAVVDAGFIAVRSDISDLDTVVDTGFAATAASFIATDSSISSGFSTTATTAQVAAIPTSVWTRDTAVNYGAGSFGEYIKTNLDVPISSSTALVRLVDGIDVDIEEPEITIDIDTSTFEVSS